MFALVTHSVLSIVGVLIFNGLGFPLPWIVFFISAVFYMREQGQREHDLKNMGWKTVRAWLGATFAFGWSFDNFLQWVVPTLVAIAVACLLFYTGYNLPLETLLAPYWQ